VSVSITVDQLLDYSDHERAKWREWLSTDPRRLELPVQPGGRFPTVGVLLDHIFFVERRLLCRLEGGTPPDASGVAPADLPRLLEYGELVRADFRHYASELDDAAGSEIVSFDALGVGPLSVTRRRLMTHVLLHETRHLAQLALAARLAGVDPPGGHDLMLFADFDRPSAV
jgi:uncharacterized damage-inducible protein DinB